MCTLIVATGHWEALPLLIAANRDERLDRPASAPRVWDRQPWPILAPVDEQAGGTWLGINAAGVFAGVTNRRTIAPDPDRRSRGLLVLDALEADSAAAAAERIAAVPAKRHNPFHLVMADRESAWLVWDDGTRVVRRRLAAGVHAITERSCDGSDSRARYVSARIRDRWGPRPPSVAAVGALLAEQADPPQDGPCIVVPGAPYGTRSSTVAAFWRARPATLIHAEGPPCRVDYRDLSDVLASVPGKSRI